MAIIQTTRGQTVPVAYVIGISVLLIVSGAVIVGVEAYVTSQEQTRGIDTVEFVTAETVNRLETIDTRVSQTNQATVYTNTSNETIVTSRLLLPDVVLTQDFEVTIRNTTVGSQYDVIVTYPSQQLTRTTTITLDQTTIETPIAFSGTDPVFIYRGSDGSIQIKAQQ